MNARMRRIDLFCKLMGPLTISLVTLASTEIAIWTTLGMNLASVFVEYIFIEQVYRRVRGLERAVENDAASRNTTSDQRRTGSTLLCGILHQVLPVESLPFYFRHPAFLASFALSLLYFTVLSFSGQMITYLVSVGYTPVYVGIARVGSSIFEISATWAAPLLMNKIGTVRAGSWSLAWQMACLAGALSWYFPGYGGMGTNSIFSASGLAVGVALSRIGLWGFDLCAQNIIQDVSLHRPGSWPLATTDPWHPRKSRTTTGVHSRLSKRLFRIYSRCFRTHQPSSSLGQTSFSTLSSPPWGLFTRLEDCTPIS